MDAANVLPDGAVVLPDGAVVLPDGAVVLPDGGFELPDGAVLLPDGAVLLPDGDILVRDAAAPLPDGAVVLPDGAVVLPDGSSPTGDAGPPVDFGTRPDLGTPPVCPGVVDPPADRACSSSDTCDLAQPDDYCVRPGEAFCATCMTSTRECEPGGTPCSGGRICVAFSRACTCPGGSGWTECRTPCTAGSCPAGETCNMASVCAAIQCNAGYTCPNNYRCTPGAGNTDAHGCQRKPCISDGECACGRCVDGICADALGTCRRFLVPADGGVDGGA